MKLSYLCFFLLLTFSTLVAGSHKDTSVHNQPVTAASSASLPITVQNVFNLRDYGAIGDAMADDGPALQRALDAIGNAGGGTLFVPAGRYAIYTPVRKDFTGLASDVSILGVESLTPVPPPTSSGQELTRGLDLTSEFAPRTREQGIAVNITGLKSFLIKHITFIGTPGVNTDAAITLALGDISQATISHCEFYGLSSTINGGAIIQAVRCNFILEQSVFLGSTVHSAYYNSVVQNIQWKGLTATETIFADYGQRAELYGKLGLAAPFSWINIGNAADADSNSPRREVVIKDVFFDEGGLAGFSSTPYRFTPPTVPIAPIDLVYISGLFMNVSNLGTWGNFIYGPQRVLIEKSHYGWSHNADSAIDLHSVGNAILDRVECVASADRIRADSATGSLTVIDSVYNHLDSLAQTTRVITTNAPDEDPVQYVRQQFSATLGRDPDAAAHFYWSNQILQCGDNLQCVGAKRAALGAYLASAPHEKFAVSGTIVDENGAALAGVTVGLGGSQNVMTVTDANGRYQFSNLPTSGAYTVTPSQSHYTFSPASYQIVTPAADQIFNSAAYVGSSPSVLGFSAASYSVAEGMSTITVTVERTGTTSSATEVTYSAIDGSAQQRSDVIPVIGRLRFEPGQTSQTFLIFITNDVYVEGNENITLLLRDLVGGVLGNNSTATLTIVDNDSSPATANPIDDTRFFVRQHYVDFLNRTPDDAGLDFWSNQILSCGTDAACIADHRINVSAAFFLSIEFQQTGFLVYRLYQASFARPPRHLDEFLLDTRMIGEGVVVNTPGWEQLLEANKTEFIKTFVARPQFSESYPVNLSPTQFVNQLNSTAGGLLSPNDLALAVGEFQGAATSGDVVARARVLRRVAENETFSQRRLNPAFVLMQYFGYLQRNPSEAPDTNLDGYNFWLHKLEEFGGDFRRAEMVKAFLLSSEYRARFGAP